MAEQRWNALWHGGYGAYSASEPGKDTETFGSLYEAGVELQARYNSGHACIQRPDTPVGQWERENVPGVGADTEFIMWKGDPNDYPDTGRRVFLGPKGGVKVETF